MEVIQLLPYEYSTTFSDHRDCAIISVFNWYPTREGVMAQHRSQDHPLASIRLVDLSLQGFDEGRDTSWIIWRRGKLSRSEASILPMITWMDPLGYCTSWLYSLLIHTHLLYERSNSTESLYTRRLCYQGFVNSSCITCKIYWFGAQGPRGRLSSDEESGWVSDPATRIETYSRRMFHNFSRGQLHSRSFLGACRLRTLLLLSHPLSLLFPLAQLLNSSCFAPSTAGSDKGALTVKDKSRSLVDNKVSMRECLVEYGSSQQQTSPCTTSTVACCISLFNSYARGPTFPL